VTIQGRSTSVEERKSHEQFDNYLAWRRDRGTGDRLKEALAEPPSIRQFDVTDA